MWYTKIYPEQAVLVADRPSPNTMPVAIHALPAEVGTNLCYIVNYVPYDPLIDHIL